METAIMFDIDNTLTPPRKPINQKMVNVLQSLPVPFHVVAGSHFSLLKKQFFKPLYSLGFRKQFEAFVSNGAIQYKCDYTEQMKIELVSEFNIRKHLGETNYNFLNEVLEQTLEKQEFNLPPYLKVCGDRITDRNSMINFCPIGRIEQEDEKTQLNRKKFARFDQESGFRRKIMDHLNKELSHIIQNKKLRIMLGGQTSFDIGILDQDKTVALRVLLKRDVDRLIFIGDALFEGGNDYVIRKFINNWSDQEQKECPVEAIQTESWQNTIEILKQLKLIS